MHIIHQALGVGFDSDTGNHGVALGTGGTTRLNRSSSSLFQIGSSAFSLGAWVKILEFPSADSRYRDIMNKSAGASPREFALNVFRTNPTTRRFRFLTDSGTLSLDSLNPSLDTWYFVQVWRVAGGNTFLSVDNNLSVNSNLAYTTANSNDFRIGWGGEGIPFEGNLNAHIDQAYFAKSDIGATLRTYLYNNGNGRKASELTGEQLSLFSGYWELKEATGTGDRLDSSPNASHLTPNISMTRIAGVTI
jgi:hypothetical protein